MNSPAAKVTCYAVCDGSGPFDCTLHPGSEHWTVTSIRPDPVRPEKPRPEKPRFKLVVVRWNPGDEP